MNAFPGITDVYDITYADPNPAPLTTAEKDKEEKIASGFESQINGSKSTDGWKTLINKILNSRISADQKKFLLVEAAKKLLSRLRKDVEDASSISALRKLERETIPQAPLLTARFTAALLGLIPNQRFVIVKKQVKGAGPEMPDVDAVIKDAQQYGFSNEQNAELQTAAENRKKELYVKELRVEASHAHLGNEKELIRLVEINAPANVKQELLDKIEEKVAPSKKQAYNALIGGIVSVSMFIAGAIFALALENWISSIIAALVAVVIYLRYLSVSKTKQAGGGFLSNESLIVYRVAFWRFARMFFWFMFWVALSFGLGIGF